MHDDRLYDEKELEKSWLISYSDLFTLLFVIIVIIAATHSAQIKVQLDEVQKVEAAQEASLKETLESKDMLELQKLELRREIGQLETRREVLTSTIQSKQTEADEAIRNMDTVKTQLAAALHELNISFEETAEGLVIRLPENVLFTNGSAELEQGGKQVVAKVARVLQRFSQKVRIEGYTDNVPIARSLYRSNWELSSARAISVMREMVDEYNLSASRFMVAGWGENNPLVDNSNDENRARNRRVELVILAEKE